MSRHARVLAVFLAMAFCGATVAWAAVGDSGPSIASDLADYNAGQTVTLTGSGWDAGGIQVHIVVNDDVGQTWSHVADVTPDADGTVTDTFQLPSFFVAAYSVVATQTTESGTLTARSSFTDANPSANLDQCANDPAPSPNTDGCSAAASDWVNGNLGGSKALYFEGDSIPYRLRFDDLSVSSHTVTIEWDTTKSDTHALDYLTTFNRTVATANPLLGVNGPGSPTTFAIPTDGQVTGAGVTPVAGNFTMYGGTITAASAYGYADGPGFSGDKSARITLTFNASQANPVLAWGGHISSRADWGANNSAVAISGSPYHTRLIGLDGSGGNQDRSLSADAVVFPGSLKVVKQATPESGTSFGFTASPAPLSNFSLVDDGTTTNTKLFGNITNFQPYTVNESSIPATWGFDSAGCTVSSPNGGGFTINSTTASVNLKEGENWTCTYLNSIRVGTLVVKKHVINDDGGTHSASAWQLHAKSGTTDVSGSPAAGSEDGTSYTLNGGDYTVSETGGPSGYTQTSIGGDCANDGTVTVVAGQTKTCTITNDDIAPTLIVKKHVVNDNGGIAVAANWMLHVRSGADEISDSPAAGSESGTTYHPSAGSYAVSETGAPSGYAQTSIGGDCSSSGAVTLAVGETKTCTITNDDIAPTLIVKKHVVNDNGGIAVAANWMLHVRTADPLVEFASDLGSETGTTYHPPAGAYGISETGGLSGYAQTSVTGDCDALGSVTLAVGDTKTCTITNDDIAPALHLRKTVVNDNGGTKTVAAFPLTADGAGANDLSGTSPVDSGAGLKADTFALSETNVAGYSAGPWVCTGGSQSGANITLGLGQDATCTITNDDKPGKIVVIKNAKPANGTFTFNTTSGVANQGPGSAWPGSFTLTGSTSANGNTKSFTVDAGSYTVQESTQLSWVLTGIGGSSDPNTPYDCTLTGSGGSTGTGDLNTAKTTISIKNGDTVTCVFENTGNGATRTQGFWATHSQLANIAWFGGSAFNHTFPGVGAVTGIGDRTLCGRSIDTLAKLMGGFWSDVSKTTTAKKRSALDQSRMQLLQQLLSAELNASAFGSVPASGSSAAWEAAYCGTNASAMQTAQQQAASFNSSGDSATFTPGTSADSKTGRSIANQAFWDVLP
jgi:hypothetical protein